MAIPSAVPRIDTTPMRSHDPSEDPSPPIAIPKPKLLLRINDLSHPASKLFLKLIPDLATTLETALTAIIQNLYTPPDPSPTSSQPTFEPSIPPTRSVTIFLRDIGGVAYTTGKELDNDHKEIHFSLSYIHDCRHKLDPRAELVGVLTHELVHCYQYAGPRGDSDIPHAPGGLVEGVADFVRLKAGLEPPHWTRPNSAKERGTKWDQGYQHTAYFLAWLEDFRVGKGAVGMLNDRLLRVGYIGEGDADKDQMAQGKQGFWKGLFGVGIDELWEEYGKYLDDPEGAQDTKEGGGNWEDEIVNRCL